MSKSSNSDQSFDAILEFLEDHCEFHAGCYERSYLERRINARLRRTDREDYSGYYELLEADNGEREDLVDALSINVTEFFRNPELWSALVPFLADRIEAEGTISCWSAACADGREPYSLAMLANEEEELNERKIEILATDIDQDALEAARDGVYHDLRTVDIGEQLEPLSDFEQYIEHDDGMYAVKPSIRSLVQFRHHDLVEGDSPGEFDFVLCRNLLIYIDTDAKRAILETLTDSLKPGGYLVIGMSETIPRDMFDALEPVDRSRRIYKRR